MKGRIYTFLAFIIGFGFCGCSKSDPAPAPPVTTSTGSTGNTGTGTGTTTLAITDFSPKSAKPGSNITITGTGFGSDLSTVKVAIGNSPYNVPISVTPTSIVVKTDLSTPTGKISVKVGTNTAISATDFTALLPPLQLVGFDINTAPQLGHQFYMSVQGVGSDTSKIKISFGGTQAVDANYIADDGLTIGMTIPRYAKQGTVTLTVGQSTATSPQSLSFGMSMADFTPKTFSQGDTVKITGFGFTNTNDMSVNFNTTTNSITRPISVTATQMLVVVPFNATSGNLAISANAGTISDVNYDTKYTFIPTVYFDNAFTPSSGKVGDIIRINGDFTGYTSVVDPSSPIEKDPSELGLARAESCCTGRLFLS